MNDIQAKVADVLYKGGYLKSFDIDGGMEVSNHKIDPGEPQRIQVKVATASEVLVDIDMEVPYEMVLQVLSTIINNLPSAAPKETPV